MPHDLVLYEQRGPVVLLRLNRPDKRNAFNAAMADALRRATARLAAAPDALVGVLTGGDKVFSAGMDLKAYASGEGEAILHAQGRFAGFVDARCPKPLIAAVEGAALAGGFELALACDLIVAGEGAFFGLPEVRVGLFAAAGGAFRLPRRIPAAKAIELLLTGDRLSAADAERLGLVNALAPDGQALAAAVRLAEKIASNAPLGVSASLTIARASAAAREQRLWKLTDEAWERVSGSRDAREGAHAFLEKRPPRWEGK